MAACGYTLLRWGRSPRARLRSTWHSALSPPARASDPESEAAPESSNNIDVLDWVSQSAIVCLQRGDRPVGLFGKAMFSKLIAFNTSLWYRIRPFPSSSPYNGLTGPKKIDRNLTLVTRFVTNPDIFADHQTDGPSDRITLGMWLQLPAL